MEKIRLGDAFSFIRNGANTKQGVKDGGYPITRIETISDRAVNREKMGYAGITDVSKYDDYILQDGDILMSHINSEKHLGKTAIYKKQKDEKIIHGMNLLCLRPDNSQILPEYAFYFLSSNDFLRQIPNITKKSVNQASFTVTALKKLSFAKRGIDEQKKIVCELDKVTVLTDKRKKQLEKLDELVKSRFIEMFGDPVTNPHGFEKVTLSDLAEIKIGPFGSLLHKEDYIEGGHALVNPSHIIDGKVSVDERLTVSDDKFAELSAYHLQIGDVVMGRRGEMGRCAVVLDDGLLCGTGSLLIRTKGEVTADYIQKIISFPSFKKTIEDMAVGQTMPNLNVPIVSGFQIIKPPMEVQHTYYKFVEQLDKSKFEIKQSLEMLELLKKSTNAKIFWVR